MPIHYFVFIVFGTVFGVWVVVWCIGRCCFNQYGHGNGGADRRGGSIAV